MQFLYWPTYPGLSDIETHNSWHSTLVRDLPPLWRYVAQTRPLLATSFFTYRRLRWGQWQWWTEIGRYYSSWSTRILLFIRYFWGTRQTPRNLLLWNPWDRLTDTLLQRVHAGALRKVSEAQECLLWALYPQLRPLIVHMTFRHHWKPFQISTNWERGQKWCYWFENWNY